MALLLRSNTERAALKMWYRGKSCLYFTMFLLTCPFWFLISLVLWLHGFIRRFKLISNAGEQNSTMPENLSPGLRRTVLVTDVVQTKSLHVVRILAKAGHRIILADSKNYKHSGASWSKYVSRVIYVPHHDGETMNQYVDQMVKIAIDENVDWFVPISKTLSATPNYMVEAKLAKLCPRIRCFGFGDLEFSKVLNDKRLFLKECQRLGLSVPDFKIISQIEELYKLRDEGFFETVHYFLKPVLDYSEDRSNFTRIPSETNAFKEYVKDYEDKIASEQPYFVCEYIKGCEYASNAICRDGQLLTFQVCPSSSTQIEYETVDHPEIREWTEQFCKKMRITGGICFDFLQDDVTKKIYCIECNPRLHSAITSFHYDPTLAIAFQAVLEPENVQEEKTSFPIEPPKSSPRVYWLLQEFKKLFTGRQGVSEFFSTLRHGREAVYDDDDPLPFLILNTLHLLFQFKKKIVSGARWVVVNPCLGRLGR